MIWFANARCCTANNFILVTHMQCYFKSKTTFIVHWEQWYLKALLHFCIFRFMKVSLHECLINSFWLRLVTCTDRSQDICWKTLSIKLSFHQTLFCKRCGILSNSSMRYSRTRISSMQGHFYYPSSSVEKQVFIQYTLSTE